MMWDVGCGISYVVVKFRGMGKRPTIQMHFAEFVFSF